MMALYDEMKIAKDEQQILEGEPDLNRMGQVVQNMFKPKNFYDQRQALSQLIREEA